MLSKEELLKPRRKIIALWPYEPERNLGIIITEPDCPKGGQWTAKWKDWEELGKYPHLIKKLEWWEERSESDMPEYLLCICKDFIKFKIGQIIAVEKHFSNTFNQRVNLFISKEKQSHEAVTNCFNYKDFLPATKSEYEQYLSLINKTK